MISATNPVEIAALASAYEELLAAATQMVSEARDALARLESHDDNPWTHPRERDQLDRALVALRAARVLTPPELMADPDV